MRALRTLSLCCLMLAGCAGGPGTSVQRDSGPSGPVDLSGVREPEPRWEPPSRRGNPESYEVFGRRYRVLASAEGYRERGIASWYGSKFHGRLTSNGEVYDMYGMTAAHKSLPLPTYVRVTNLGNGRSVVVRVNDRGPFHDGRIIDLSYAAAHRLGVDEVGTAPVEVQALTFDAPGATVVAGAAPPPAVPAAAPVTLAEAAPVPALLATPAAEPGGGFYIQVGAFGERANAEQMRERLAAADLPPVSVEEARDGARAVYRVRIGPLQDRTAAEEVALHLDILGLESAPLIHLERSAGI